MDFYDWLKCKTDNIENYLGNSIHEENDPQNIIYKAMNYSLLSGGKRLRPLLLLAAYELFYDNELDVMPFACMMEMIHTYSLIHDDLPAMDNDDFRRGMLSNHKKYGEATAILAGDGLLNKAFETGIYASLKFKEKYAALQALSAIAQSSGACGMIGGQVVDMDAHGKIKTIEDLKYMYSLKTGAIIKSSIAAGAILGGANDMQLAALKNYAENIGLAFQIKDDILDVTSTLERLGKKTGSDAANDKITYLSFVSLDEAQRQVENLTYEAINELDIFEDKARRLTELANYLTKRDH